MKHLNLKRIVKRIKEEIVSTIEVARVLNIKSAFYSLRGKLDIQIMVHNGHVEYPRIKKNLMKKHEAMSLYFEKKCTGVTEESLRTITIPEQDRNYCDCIWVCWWQGLDNAPDIVKRCVGSIQTHAGNHKVVIITDKNYKKFIEFPEWINVKYKKGLITKTHLSDLLRVSLLAKYGGVWLDSTFYCVDDLEYCFNSPIWSIKRPDYRHVSVACGEFANYSFGCTSEDRVVFAILREYLLDYWRNYDYMIDYLFLDYLIVLARKRNQVVDDAFKQIHPNNKNCDELLKILGRPYNPEIWEKMKEDTGLFKLTWKANFPKETDGKQTFYKMLLNGNLL